MLRTACASRMGKRFLGLPNNQAAMRSLFDVILNPRRKQQPRLRLKQSGKRVVSIQSTTREETEALPKYEHMKDTLLAENGITVQKWRTNMSGVAILAVGSRGERYKLLESPYPRGPVSAAVFCHEVSHHILGVGSIKPRCLEELAAWDGAIELMERFGIRVTERVLDRRERSLRYAVYKARRSGLKSLPSQLEPFDVI